MSQFRDEDARPVGLQLVFRRDPETGLPVEGRLRWGLMTRILAAQSVEMRAKGEALIRQADKLLCESWNERMWSDGEPIDPSPTIDLPVIYSEHLTGDGQEMFEHAAKLNFEGIVSKRADAPYRSERAEAWLKIKTVQKGKFPVIGFVKDPTGVATLYLGKHEGKELVYMGKVGTGWSRTVSSQIRKQLDTVVSPKSMLTPASQKRPGSSRRSWPRSDSATSPRRGCFGKALSRA
jgi:hypothetical protein